VIHREVRAVLKGCGPELYEIASTIKRYVKMSEAYDKRYNPPSRFKTLLSPEESYRKFQENLKRAYGEGSVGARHIAEQAAGKAKASTLPVPVNQPSTDSFQHIADPPNPPKSKPDVIAVPLMYSPEGLLCYDWDNARPDG
jgi:hypothetical protein